jgi:micrococcal nuclease
MTRRQPLCDRRAALHGTAAVSLRAVLLSFSILFLSLASQRAAAEEPELRVQVISVRNCDEMAVRHKAKILAIRIAGIDCPHRPQPFATEAKAFVGTLVNKHILRVKPVGHDRHRRIWANVFLPDGRSLSYEMVKSGWAHASATAVDERLAELEQEARRTKLGLWDDSRPAPAATAKNIPSPHVIHPKHRSTP